MTTMPYPQPLETPTNAPMLAAWRQDGALALQRCAECGHTFFYPRAVCPRCWSPRLEWVRATGEGHVLSFSRIHRGLAEPFAAEAPIVLAEIALPEGASLIARVTCDDPHAVRSGMAVRLLPMPDAARYPLPTFRPA